jgi:serine/threonine protein kinase
VARFLGSGSQLKSPRTTRTYTVMAAARWEGEASGLRPPPHIIGVGGFGVTYRVMDERGEAFAMKEYFPRDHALRGADGLISARRSEGGFSKRIYDEGLRRFVAEGQLLSAFSHPNVCRVVDTFDENRTSYQVMKLVEGREVLGESDTGGRRIERRVTLEDYFRELESAESGTAIDVQLLSPILAQLLDAVEYIHTEGTRKAQEITGTVTRALLHRDIKPSNVLVEAPPALMEAPAAEIIRHPDTRVLLIDFGSARMFREVESDDVSRSIGVVTEGYAPPELKDNQIEQQGPHSDIYSLAALVWRAFTGRKPTTAQLANGAKLADLATPVRGPDGIERPRASKTFLMAVDKALNAAVGQRPQSIAEWRQALRGGASNGGGGGGQGGAPLVLLVVAGLAAAVVIVVAGIGLLAWIGLSSPLGNIREQSRLAYEDARKLATVARAEAASADQDARAGADQYDPAIAEAKAGNEKFDSATRFHYAADEGDPAQGDVRRHIVIEAAKIDSYWWCYRKSDAVIPDKPYTSYTYPDFTLDGVSGWACGVPHSRVVTPAAAVVKNPWKITGDGYFYNGDVDDTAARPLGLGQVVFGDHAVSGRFSGDASSYAVLGELYVNNRPSRAGRFHLAVAPKPAIATWSGQEAQGGKIGFSGRGTSRGRVGRFDLTAGQTLGAETGDGSVITGQVTLADGGTWYGSVSPSGAAAARSWGRIETLSGTYHGQITNGKPDGCGLWDRNGRLEVGVYSDGDKQDGADLGQCRNVRYSAQVSASDFAASTEGASDAARP